jgi:replicative DNA helicase
MKQFRQGDVYLVEIDERDARDISQAKKRTSNVLLEGEATGHAHKFDQGEAEILDIPQPRWNRREDGVPQIANTFVRVKKEARLNHDEHGAIIIPVGFYRMTRQREFDGTNPGVNMRWVAD